jgi:hypothetical protein
MPDFGVPTDPAYVAFEAELERVLDSNVLPPPDRWSPREGRWMRPSASLLRPVPLEHTTTSVHHGSRPDLFREITRIYAAGKAAYPNALWTTFGGTWEQVGTSTGGGDDADRARDRARRDMQNELEFARRQYADGVWDIELYRRTVTEIERKYRDLI